MPTPSPSLPEHRRLSIRLPQPLWIGLTAAVLLVVAVGLWLGAPIWRQLATVQAIESQSGAVGTVHHLPESLRTWLGFPTCKAFEKAEFVNWERGPITDASLDQLLGLRTLRRLNLRHTRVTDAGIARLRGLPNLQLLLLEGTDVTELGIAELQNALPALRVQK